jgi:hypothetical protein
MVVVPSVGGTEQVWYRANGCCVYNRIAINGQGNVVIFASYPGGKVYALTKPGENPKEIADVAPDGDIRQLALSQDGAWAAFTASSFLRNGKLSRLEVNLYVVATNGSAHYRITTTALPDKFISFDLSADGKTIVWVDDPKKGPWIADTNGQNAKRLPIAPDPIQSVFSNPAGDTIYYQTINATGVRLLAVSRTGTTPAVVNEASHGHYYVARDSGTVLLAQDNRDLSAKRTYWRVDGSTRTKLFSVKIPGYAGSCALSGNGGAAAWVDPAPADENHTFVWNDR